MMKWIERFLLPALLLLSLTVACSARNGHLIPLGVDNEEETILASQPRLVTFSQLQADPDAFRDRLIRVSGSLLKAGPPDCLPYSGPASEWALIAEELRLDATGFEREVSMLGEGLPMTVDGYFRLYEGALGCGKTAPDGSAWTLQVLKIAQPNPLVASVPQPGGFTSVNAAPVVPAISPGTTATPANQVTTPAVATAEGTAEVTATGSGLAIPTATPIPGAATRTPIPTASFTPAATSRFTATPTSTPRPGTPTSVPTPTPRSTSLPGSTPTHSPTATTSPYPGPGTPTPTATPTIEGYPGQPTATPSYP